MVMSLWHAENEVRYIVVPGLKMCLILMSSRRRHTIYWRDWSSDVCSSDLMVRRPPRSALMVPASNLYVHFQSDYIAFQQPGGVTADFWNLNVGKLMGLLHQKLIGQTDDMYQARIDDGLIRFAGTNGFPNDGGFGHPFAYSTY